MRTWSLALAAAAFALLAAPIGTADEEKKEEKKEEKPKEKVSYLGKVLPELPANEGTWLNTEKPITLAGLRGKVVLLMLTSLG